MSQPHRPQDSHDTEVLVVGAGPTGLLLASELALAGVRVEVIERLAEPDTTIKAGSINVATAEALDRRGLLPAAREAQGRFMHEVARFMSSRPAGARLPGNARPSGRETPVFPVTGHFAGMMFRPDLVDQADPVPRGHLATSGATVVPQRDVEALLADHASALGVTVKRGVELLDLTDDGDQHLTVHTSAGVVTADWVVGADGGRSKVRKLAGIDFPGTEPETTGHQAVVDIDGADALRAGWTWTEHGVYSYGPIPGRILTVRFDAPPPDRSAPVTLEELQRVVRHVTGADVTLTALHGTATRWTDNCRQATTYRRGRVLLAGDAAHVHPPFSGQGLNLGIGDAINLGWKLAATIHGWAPDGLLDTYTAERHPIGEWVLDWTRAQVALMRGDTKTAALREVVEQRLLGTRQAMSDVVLLSSGVAQHYASDGAASATVDTDFRATPDPATQPGRLLGDVDLADGTRLADHAHRNTFVLLDRTDEHAFSRLAAPWHDRVVRVADTVGDEKPGAVTGLLVRPDGVIAWATHDQLSTGLTEVLRRWAGQPDAEGEHDSARANSSARSDSLDVSPAARSNSARASA